MTWAEFKKAVDEELKRRGIKEDSEIEYIDYSVWAKGFEVFDFTDDSIGIEEIR